MAQIPEQLVSWLGVGGGVSVIAYAGIRLLYRRAVRDGLEVAKDRGETDLVQKLLDMNKTLTDQNTSLRADFERLSTERANTLSKVGKLESDLEHTNSDLQEALVEVAMLRRQLGLKTAGDLP